MINRVLVEPEIPQNTGNIVRTCVATKSKLHLIKPLGFEVTDKQLKRAGLDYWYDADITYYENIQEFFEKNKGGRFFYFTTKAKHIHSSVKYEDNDFLVFGKETKGLDEKLLHDNYDSCVRIPMFNDTRSLNLSNSVAIAVYESLRQLDYYNLNTKGHLTKFDD